MMLQNGNQPELWHRAKGVTSSFSHLLRCSRSVFRIMIVVKSFPVVSSYELCQHGAYLVTIQYMSRCYLLHICSQCVVVSASIPHAKWATTTLEALGMLAEATTHWLQVWSSTCAYMLWNHTLHWSFKDHALSVAYIVKSLWNLDR